MGVLRILIVEDDAQFAATLKYLIEENAFYCVVGTADDAESALCAVDEHSPDVVLLDLHLARGSTGFTVAVKLVELNILCLIVSGKAPTFPMADLAIGCLTKPFTADELHRSLSLTENILRGRETLYPKVPPNLTLYEQGEYEDVEEPTYPAMRLSPKARLRNWMANWVEKKLLQ